MIDINKLKHKLGWKRHAFPSTKLTIFKFTELSYLNAIHIVDLRQYCPPIYDQGDLGSCTAFAISASYEFDEKKQNVKNEFKPSQLFIYYNERLDQGDINDDTGASIEESVTAIVKYGVCPTMYWPYDITKFATKPPLTCYSIALINKAKQYSRLSQILNQLKSCLISGLTFVFGFNVYESFISNYVALTGIVPLPNTQK